MLVISIVSTKGGVGKTTVTANLGGFLADAGLRVLLIDLDAQPTLSSYYKLPLIADCGIFEFIADNEQDLVRLISHTSIANLHLVVSNDSAGQLNSLLLNAADGRLRLRHLLPIFAPCYDILLIDTQGARSVMLDMAVLASDRLVSPVPPEVLAAREFGRGTLQLIEDLAPYQRLGIRLPIIELLINRVSPVSSNARLVQHSLHELFDEAPGIHLLQTTIPAIEAYAHAATLSMPAHRYERWRPSGRLAPAALDSLRALACELLPNYSELFAGVTGKIKMDIHHASLAKGT